MKNLQGNMEQCIPASVIHEPEIVPHFNDLQKAADMLNEGKKVAMLDWCRRI